MPPLDKLKQNIDALDNAGYIEQAAIGKEALANTYASLKNLHERMSVLESQMRGANV